jgi:hypothetical protein
MSIDRYITTRRIIDSLSKDSPITINQLAAIGFLIVLERSRQYGKNVVEMPASNDLPSNSLIEYAEGLYGEICESIEDDLRNDV